MIPTLVERTATFNNLMESIKEKHARICPDLKIEYCIAQDNREQSIGKKRQTLLQGAKGKYVSFVDDDDSLTDAYFEDALECIRGRFEVCRLRGQMAQYTFTHSIENTLNSPMARGQVFLRPPNHLNIMLGEVAKIVPFGDAVRGEDLDWTISLARLDFFNKEYRSDESRIHYIYQLGTRTVHPSTLEMQKTTNYATMLRMVWTPHGAVLPPTPKTKELRLTGKGFVSK
jgi:hypothetical protein